MPLAEVNFNRVKIPSRTDAYERSLGDVCKVDMAWFAGNKVNFVDAEAIGGTFLSSIEGG